LMRHGVSSIRRRHVTAILLAVMFTGANPSIRGHRGVSRRPYSAGEVPQPQTNAPATPTGRRRNRPGRRSPVRSGMTQPSSQEGNEGIDGRESGCSQTARARPREAEGAAPSPLPIPSGREAPPPAAPPGHRRHRTLRTHLQCPGTPHETRPATQGSDQVPTWRMFGMPLDASGPGGSAGRFDAPAIETDKIERSAVDASAPNLKNRTALPAGISSNRENLAVGPREAECQRQRWGGRPTH